MAHLAHYAIDFFKEIVTGFEGDWAYDLGQSTLTADPDFIFEGVVQPATQADLQILPELQRSNEPLTLHTRRQLSIADKEGEKQTYIRWKNRIYKVIAFGNWSVRTFYKYGLTRVESIPEGR